MRRYNGIITECEPSTTSREATFAEVQPNRWGFRAPYNDPRVIAGQGTCSKEFMEQTDGIDMVIAPIGGGGMVSGTCLTLSTLAPKRKSSQQNPNRPMTPIAVLRQATLSRMMRPKRLPMGYWCR